MQTNAANNYVHFEAVPSTSTTLLLTALKSPLRCTGSTVLELSFQLAETVVPTLSGLPSHSRSRDPLVIWSHAAGSYQQAARNVLGKTK